MRHPEHVPWPHEVAATRLTSEAYAKALRCLEGAAASDQNLPAVARWLVDEIWTAAERSKAFASDYVPAEALHDAEAKLEAWRPVVEAAREWLVEDLAFRAEWPDLPPTPASAALAAAVDALPTTQKD